MTEKSTRKAASTRKASTTAASTSRTRKKATATRKTVSAKAKAKATAKTKKKTTTKSTARKTTARKTTARKTTARKTTTRKTTTRKTTTRKTASRKATAKKATTRKATSGKASAAKTESQVAAAQQAAEPERRERLHKFLASTGAGSRRECETFIAQGRVSLNGKVVAKMGVKVDPVSDLVTLDGERVRAEERVYYLLNKPGGVICTNSDERGRPRAVELIREEQRRIYTVGRLDADSTGLVLLTNDGGIANIVCHPRYRIEKRYQVHVRGFVRREQIAQVEAGVWLAEGKSSPALVKPIGRNPKRGETILEMTLFEGRNREIRRVFAKVGLTVRRLQRTMIGPLTLGNLAPGAYRRLTQEDLTFVSEAEHMYLANQAAWDAELPPEEGRRRRPMRQRRPMGDRGGRPSAQRRSPDPRDRREGADRRDGRDRRDTRRPTSDRSPREGGRGGQGLSGASFPRRGRRRTERDGGGARRSR